MSMTIAELIFALEDIRDSSNDGENAEVRIAYQRNYPLAGTVAAVTELVTEDGGSTVAWIAVGAVGWDESPYASSEAWSNQTC